MDDESDDTLFLVMLIVGIFLTVSLVVFIGFQAHARGCVEECLVTLEKVREYYIVLNPTA